MELIENLKKEEFEKFITQQENTDFLQSYEWGQFAKDNKKLIPHYIGLKDGKKVVAAALLLEKKLPLNKCYLYSPRGYIIDYTNKKLLKVFSEFIKKYAKKNGCIFIKINPNLKLHAIDNNGNPIAGEDDNHEVIKTLKNFGYKHLGFPKNFEQSEPRYTFCLNLEKSLEDIINDFHPTTKKIIKKGNIFNLKIIKNKNANIEDFYLTMKETAKREGVLYHDIEYYEQFYNHLKKHGMSDLYVIKADINELKKYYTDKEKELQEKLEKLSIETKKQEIINQLIKCQKQIKELEEIHEDELTLSSILTVKYNNKVSTVHGGNHCLLRELNANYLIYFEIIKDAKEEGYKKIDFFGTTGNPDENNPIYGIHLFKKRLGGEYIEYIGEFDFIISKFYYFLFTKLIPIYRKLKRKRNLKKSKND